MAIPIAYQASRFFMATSYKSLAVARLTLCHVGIVARPPFGIWQ